MNRILIITEKSSVSKPMAQAMGWAATGGGFEGIWNGNKVRVEHARGHLLTLESPDDIDSDLGWNKPLELAPLPKVVKAVPIPPKKTDTGETAAQRLGKIAHALKNADEVILATDADREGEYIGWLILEHLQYKGKVRRCWLAEGMDDKSVQKAMANILPASEKKSLARAAEARAHCDWSYMYLVRLLTYYGRHGLLGSHLGRGAGRESVVSTGRVQSAALYMIYMREMAIRNFKPQKFYKVMGDFSIIGNELEAEYEPRVTQQIIDSQPEGVSWVSRGKESENKLDEPLFISKPHIDDFHARLLAKREEAKIVQYKEETKEQHPPITYDLVAAKAELVKVCKINGDAAQAVIEDLYEQGYISYPRTAHGELPNNLYEPSERDPRLRCVMGVPGLKQAAEKALDIHSGKDSSYKPFKPKSFVSKKLEHHGLIPSNKNVTAAVLAGLTARKKVNNKLLHKNEHMQAGYRLIAERFVQAMLPPARIATQRIVIDVPVKDLLNQPSSIFVAKASRTLDSGWRGIMNKEEKAATNLPKLEKGTQALLERIKLTSGETKAPHRYNESSFEKALQNAAREINDPVLRAYLADGGSKPEGIGTPATRQTIIPTLKARGYVRDEKRTFFLEPKGEEYIEYQMSAGKHWLYRIETTAEWEGRLSEMAGLEDDVKACEMRDAFIAETKKNIEEYIHWMNDRYANAEKKQLPRVAPKVTENMRNAIKSIAQSKGLTVAPAVLKDPKKAAEFFEKYGNNSGEGGSSAPSDKQIELIDKITKTLGIDATSDQRSDRKLASAFIDLHKDKLFSLTSAAAPSERMIKFARDLAAKLPETEKPDQTVFQRMDLCREFIDKHAGNSKGKQTSGSGSKGGVNTARGSARRSPQKRG